MIKAFKIKAFKLLSLIFVAAIFLSACTVNLERKKPAEKEYYEDKYDVIDKGPVKGGSIRLFTTPVDTLNPILSNNAQVQDFLGLVFEGLYVLDYAQQPVPLLAASSTLSYDSLTLTIKLRENIKWQDKMPFKAEDVVFTINTIMDKKNNSVYSKNVQYIETATAEGNNTVILKLKQPYSFIKHELTFPIIPAHYFVNEKLTDKKSKVNLAPIGTGPYSFNSFNEETGVKLIINDGWWNAGGANGTTDRIKVTDKAGNKSDGQSTNGKKLPYISSIEIKILNDSQDANAAFQARDIDVLPAFYEDYRRYIGRTDIILKRYPGRNFEFLTLNIKKGQLSDKRLRNAINLFLDKKQLVEAAAPGIAVPAEIPVQPNSWVYQLIGEGESRSLDDAKALMHESGYVQDSKNKYIKKATKKPLTLKLIVNEGNALRFNTATEIATQLGKQGVTVEVTKLSWEDYKKAMITGAYDLALTGYRISSVPDLSFAYSSTEIDSGLNTAGYSNPVVDEYLQKILATRSSELQAELYTNLFRTVLDDRPYIGLYFLNESMMYSKNIRGAVNPYVWNKYNDISRWYLP